MTPDPIKQAGDSALLLELGDAAIDPELNARAIAVARVVRERAIPGVRDVVSTFRSVAVFFNPLSTDVATVAAALHEAADVDASREAGRVVDIPVVYGGDGGPDMTEVAAFAGCTPEEVVERHAAKRYRVYMLGFLPGFAYMARTDPAIAVPRRATPRLRVAAGSVGIAGAQTGIYPRESPGGWQIIGRTPMTLFDLAQTPPALLAPGDEVRFVPIESGHGDDACGASPVGFARASLARLARQKSRRIVTVLRPGLLTTVQDAGRWGHQSLGVPVAGPMDSAAHRTANVIVGNPPDAATLEATLVGPELRVEQETRVAVAGGDLRATLDGADVRLCAPLRCPKGAVLRFGDRRSGTRAYVAFDGGGVASEPVLGSRATHVASGLGGDEGRPLKAGDRLPLGEVRTDGPATSPTRQPDMPAGGARLRVLPGPQADYFAPSALDALQRIRFTISPRSNRMGYRLAGGTIEGRVRGEMISDVTVVGGLQIPPSGDPILLMADRQTTGGYPQLAVLISADLPVAGQLGPGDWMEFEVCSRTDAIAALVAAEGRILALR
jgi:KipI family sensor histidine kinase inhibitor